MCRISLAPAPVSTYIEESSANAVRCNLGWNRNVRLCFCAMESWQKDLPPHKSRPEENGAIQKDVPEQGGAMREVMLYRKWAWGWRWGMSHDSRMPWPVVYMHLISAISTTIQPVRSSTYSRSNRQDHGGIKSFLRESKATHLPPRHFYVLGPPARPSPMPVFRRLYCTVHTSSAASGPCLRLLRGHCFAGSVG